MPHTDSSEFAQTMRQLSQDVAPRRDLDERELVARWFADGVFSSLDYGPPGEDIRLEERVRRGRVDVVLRAFTGRPVCVIEFKRPGTDLSQHVAQLRQYVDELLPDAAALTNGVQFWLFLRRGEVLEEPPTVYELVSLSGARARALWDQLRRHDVDLANLDSVRGVLLRARERPVLIGGPDDIGGKEFLNRFSLTPNTAFSRLVLALCDALPALVQQSQFTAGAFAFWVRAYARELEPGDAPRAWQQLLGGQPDRTRLRHFMFALETAYAFLSRVMLAKAMQDHRFPHLDIIDAYERGVSSLQTHAVLQYIDHLHVASGVFDDAGRQGFASLFASDIFDWWQDGGRLGESRPLCEALAEAMISVLAFDFSALTGDLLGTLYQSYFDAETRRALGEFYTPPEVVQFILDQVGYEGHGIRTRRLLDPACGSGTFLICALQRYLAAAEGDEPRQVLADLIGGLRIVGLDINPFATLMSQVNYAAQILPLYARALSPEPGFMLDQLPVFRTDSLRFEKREAEEEHVRAEEAQAARPGRRRSGRRPLPGQPGFRLTYSADRIDIRDRLPVRTGRGQFVPVVITVPRYDVARERNLVSNPEEYVFALGDLFAAAASDDAEALVQRLRTRGVGAATELADFMAPAIQRIRETLARLRAEYEDGRFLKAMADLALACVLKNELAYDYVVGNPPYVRIQRIPEFQREYWQEQYSWARGNFDAYIPFIERAITQWLRAGGKLSFVCSDRFLLANYAQELRSQLPQHVRLDGLVDFRVSTFFEDAGNSPAVFAATKGAGAGSFPAVRVRAKVSEQDLRQMIGPIASVLRRRPREDHEWAGGFDVFQQPADALTPDGWYLMPRSERRVFDALDTATRDRLLDLTVTGSGGFQGVATGADEALVFRLVEERGASLLLQPKGGGRAAEIERGAIRPWLFGRDVERWHVAWDGWYVLFPYVRVEGTYRLVPSRQAAERFPYAQQTPFIEDEWEGAWRYLTRPAVERILRSREHARFARGSRESHMWYGVARPQNLEWYEVPKLVVQIASPSADVAYDCGGHVFQAGGRGGGVYGILVDETRVRATTLQAMLNSAPLDFYLRHVSPVFNSSGSYSYSDAFLKRLPIRLPQDDRERSIAGRLAELAADLSSMKASLRSAERQRGAFPAAQAEALGPSVNLYPLSQLAEGTVSVGRLDRSGFTFERTLDGRVGLRSGRHTVVLPSQAQADVVAAWLELETSRQVDVGELIALRLPDTESGCRELLRQLHDERREIRRLQESLVEGEAEVDELVFELYGLGRDREAKEIVRDFLERF